MRFVERTVKELNDIIYGGGMANRSNVGCAADEMSHTTICMVKEPGAVMMLEESLAVP